MKLGDHIFIETHDRSPLGKTINHHGIYCGNGLVIHYQGKPKIIARTSLGDFAREAFSFNVYVKDYQNHVVYSPDEVVRRAESRLGEMLYNFAVNNCEHFASWCKTGKHDSPQINEHANQVLKTAQSAQGNPSIVTLRLINEVAKKMRW